jgi:hypothetical protein
LDNRAKIPFPVPVCHSAYTPPAEIKASVTSLGKNPAVMAQQYRDDPQHDSDDQTLQILP